MRKRYGTNTHQLPTTHCWRWLAQATEEEVAGLAVKLNVFHTMNFLMQSLGSADCRYYADMMQICRCSWVNWVKCQTCRRGVTYFTEAYWWDFESSHRHVEAASFWGTASPSARRHQQNGWKMNAKGPQPQTLLCDLCAGSIKQFWDMVNHGHFFCEFHSGQASLELRGTWQVSRGKLEIHGGVYDLKSGRVESLGWRLPGSIESLLVAGRWWYRHGHHPHHTMVSLMCHSWGFPLLILDNYFWCVWRWPWLSDSSFSVSSSILLEQNP